MRFRDYGARIALATFGVALIVAVLAGEGPNRLGSSSVYINEVLLLNRTTNVDGDGNTSAWVEIYNAGTAPVSLAGFALTNDATVPDKWVFPARTLSPRAHLIVWCSGKDRPTSSDADAADVHASFELTRGGETIILVGPDGRTEDAVSLLPQSEDRSYGRLPDATGQFRYLLTPTPKERNTGPTSATLLPSRPRFEPDGGVYRGRLEVDVSIPLPVDGYEIRYTTDGSPPNAESLLYPGPITLVTGESSNRILRAAAFYRGERVSQIETHSYFLDGNDTVLPVLSVSMDAEAFRRVQLGVDLHGPTAEEAGYVEVFDSSGRRAVGAGMGLRLHGFTGREGGFGMKKSYRMYFRDAYGGGKLRYPLIPAPVDGFDRVVLRAGNDDAFRQELRASYVRDELVREQQARMDRLASHGAWYALFVNMEYRGVYNVVERIDGDFLAARLGDDNVGFDVIHDDEASEGTLDAWNRVRELARGSGLPDDASYEQLARGIDIESFTDYMLLNIWAQNHDWPHKNFIAARPRFPHGKFVFLAWDAEMSLGLYPRGFDADTFARALEREGALSELFRALMANPGYQRLFLDRLERHLSGLLGGPALVERVRELEAAVELDLGREIREGFSDRHVELWRRNMDELESFVEHRPAALRGLIYRSPHLSVPRVLSVSPETIVVDDVATVRLSGGGFTDALRVAINGVSVRVARRISPSEVDVLVPADPRLVGMARVEVSDPGTGSSTRSGVLTVELAPGSVH